MKLFATITLSLLLSVSAFAAALVVPPPGVPPGEVIDRYVAASDEQQTQSREITMEVEIDAKLPRLRKEGTLSALRRITQLGEITYNGIRYVGDNMVKKDVIARYLNAEKEAANANGNGKENGKKLSMAITPENYKFKYKGMADSEGRWVYVFELSPRKRRLGLFKGDIWIDATTFLPAREEGQLVKNPSIFLSKVEFVREYDIRDGAAYPRRIQSSVHTRVVGKAELEILFSNVSVKTGTLQAMVCPAGW